MLPFRIFYQVYLTLTLFFKAVTTIMLRILGSLVFPNLYNSPDTLVDDIYVILWWITYMLGLVDSFSDKGLAFLWEQTVPHYWLTCFSMPMKMSFWINSLRKAKESLLESSIYHAVTVIETLSLLIIKNLRSSFPIFPPKNSQFLKPQNLLQLLLISICFSSKIKATI